MTDNTVLLATSKEDLQDSRNSYREGERYGVMKNIEKTKSMILSRRGGKRQINLNAL